MDVTIFSCNWTGNDCISYSWLPYGAKAGWYIYSLVFFSNTVITVLICGCIFFIIHFFKLSGALCSIFTYPLATAEVPPGVEVGMDWDTLSLTAPSPVRKLVLWGLLWEVSVICYVSGFIAETRISRERERSALKKKFFWGRQSAAMALFDCLASQTTSSRMGARRDY